MIFGAIAIFVYVGGEVSIGSFLVNYFGQPEIAGLTAQAAAGFVALYWGGAMVGRFFGSALLSGAKAAYMWGLHPLVAVVAVFRCDMDRAHLG